MRCGDHWTEVIWDGVRRVCRRAPVVLFHTLIVASLVPPPEASSESCQGHHPIAYNIKKSQLSFQSSCGQTHLYSSSMVPLRPLRTPPRALTHITQPPIPNINNIIIPTTRQKFTITPPLQPTHLPRMSKQLHNLMPRHPHIMMPNTPISTPRAQNMLMPRKRSNLPLMPTHRAQLLPRLHIPKLNLPIPIPNPQKRAVVGEVDAGDVRPLGCLAQLDDGASVCFPDVGRCFEGNSHCVLTRPAEKVEIKIVHHTRSIEHPLRLCRDLPRLVRRSSGRRSNRTRPLSIKRPRKLALLGEGGIGGRRRGGLLVIPQDPAVQGHSGGRGQSGGVSWGSRLGIEGELIEGGRDGGDVGRLALGYKAISLIETCTILQ